MAATGRLEGLSQARIRPKRRLQNGTPHALPNALALARLEC